MADSVQRDQNGPDWPLGMIAVTTPGTPVSIMSLVDASAVNDPGQVNNPLLAHQYEFSTAAWEIQFTACRKGASHGLAAATGNVYIVRQAQGTGSGNRDDYGDIVAVIGTSTAIQAPFRLTSNSQSRNSFGPYRYYVDADNAGDGALVTLVIQ